MWCGFGDLRTEIGKTIAESFNKSGKKKRIIIIIIIRIVPKLEKQ